MFVFVLKWNYSPWVNNDFLTWLHFYLWINTRYNQNRSTLSLIRSNGHCLLAATPEQSKYNNKTGKSLKLKPTPISPPEQCLYGTNKNPRRANRTLIIYPYWARWGGPCSSFPQNLRATVCSNRLGSDYLINCFLPHGGRGRKAPPHPDKLTY